MREINIDHFSVRRGNFLLRPISLKIQKGEIFGILGYTGSGKTVLLESICGMFPGTEGKIMYDDQDVLTIRPGDRKLGIVYQNHGLFPHMKVCDNISYGMKINHYPKELREKRTEELMEMLSITHIRNQYPGTLSGGESQRTAIARALALNPEILLLDEPFSALDPATRHNLYGEIKKIHEKFGCTIIFVTHDFEEARLLADRVGILLDGELLTVTTGRELMEKTYSDKIERFLGRK